MIEDGEITVPGTAYYGIRSADDIFIKGGNIAASGNVAAISSFSGKLRVDGGKITAGATFDFYGMDKIAIADGFAIRTDTGKYCYCDGTYFYDVKGNKIEKQNVKKIIIEKDNSIVNVTGVTLNKKTVTLEVGKTLTLTPSISPSNATCKKVVYSNGVNSKYAVVTVDEKGVVTANRKGVGSITVRTCDKGKEAVCTIKVVEPEKEKEDIAVTSVKLNKTTAKITTGDSITLKATVKPAKATKKKVTWKSSNKKVATVDKNGKVKAVKKGTAKITASTANGKKAVCTITVNDPVKVKSIRFDKKTYKVKRGKNIILKTIITPKNASNKELSFESDDKKIATVDKNGKVKGLKKGTVTITVRTKDGKKKASCKVKVQ